MPAQKHLRPVSKTDERFRAMRRPLYFAALLVAGILLVYGQAWRFGFIFLDDPIYVSGNHHVLTGINLRNLAWSFAGFHDGNWIPLTWISLMLDAAVYGSRPGGYHVTNVLLHTVNTLLLFAVFAKATGNQAQSAFVAALFALHPQHVESVAWITERKDVLSTLFGLLSLLSYVNYAQRGRRRSLAASFLYFVCSLMSKQTLVTLPFLLLLLDFWPLRRLNVTSPRLVRLVAEKAPFLAASAAFSAIALVAQRSSHAVMPLTALPLSTRCANALVVYAIYLGKTFFPRHLAVYYPHPGNAIPWTIVGAAAALLLAVSLVAIVWARRRPYLFVGWFWYLGTLTPTIGIVQIGGQQMADRYTYFPLIGVFVAVAWLIPDLVSADGRRKQLVAAVASASLVAIAAVAFVQVGYWRDNTALFSHSLECTPDNPLARSSLGYGLITQGRMKEGLEHLQRAVRMPPPNATAHYNLANGLQTEGQLDAAAEHYRIALEIEERTPDAHVNLGIILCERRQYREGKRHFLRAIEIDPELVEAYTNLGTLCVVLSEYAAAIDYCQRALDIDPRLSDCHRTIGIALRGLGRLDEAISRLQQALSISPGDDDARDELMRTVAMKRRSSGG